MGKKCACLVCGEFTSMAYACQPIGKSEEVAGVPNHWSLTACVSMSEMDSLKRSRDAWFSDPLRSLVTEIGGGEQGWKPPLQYLLDT